MEIIQGGWKLCVHAKALNEKKKKKVENLQRKEEKEEKMDQMDGSKKRKLGSLTEYYLGEKRKKEQEKEERLIKCRKLKENFKLMKICIYFIEENSSLWERGKTEIDGKKKEETSPIL